MEISELYRISDGDTGKQVADGLYSNFSGIVNDMSGLQERTDDSLETSAKTITGAINELKASEVALTDAVGDINSILDNINGEVA